MIPMWKFRAGARLRQRFILKPSERDPSVPMRLPSFWSKPACRPACST
jgi:hypothetical protein